jgi:hypothetical protein
MMEAAEQGDGLGPGISGRDKIYGHYDLSDLERAFETFARAKQEEDEATD